MSDDNNQKNRGPRKGGSGGHGGGRDGGPRGGRPQGRGAGKPPFRSREGDERPRRAPAEGAERRFEGERPAKRFEKKPFEKKPFRERPSGERPAREGGERPFRERSGEERFSSRPPREGDRPRGDRPARFERPGRDAGSRPPREGGERPFRERGSEDRFANRPPREGDRPRSERPTRFERPDRDGAPRPPREGGERPRGERPAGKSFGERSFGEKRFGGKPGEGRGGEGRSFGGPRSGGKRFDAPRGSNPTHSRPDRAHRSAAAIAEAVGPTILPSLLEPERIAKVMARAGVASRRDCEAIIAEGRVTVNGQVIESPALDVSPSDVVLIDGEPLPARERTRVWLYHKPRGLVTTNHDPEGRPTVFDALPEDLPRVLSIGRLDINTEGLLLLTNDGGLARMLELPETGWLRRYRVRAFGHVTQERLDTLKDGVTIDGVNYGPVTARFEREQGANTWLIVDLREGKNREVKNLLEHIGLQVNRLIRISFGPFQLGDLPEGEADEIRSKVLKDQLGTELMAKAGVDFEAPRRDELPAGERPARPRAPAGDDRPRRRPREDADGMPFVQRTPSQDDRSDKPWKRTVWRDEDAEPQRERRAAPRRGADPKEERQAREASGKVVRVRDKAIEDPSGRRVKVERVRAAAPAEEPREAGLKPRAPRGERPSRAPQEAFGPDRSGESPWKSSGDWAEGPPRGKRPPRAGGDEATSERPFRERPAGDKPAGRKSFGGKPFGERSGGGKSFGERSGGGKPFGGKSFGDRPAGDRPGGRGPRPGGGKPGGKGGPRSGPPRSGGGGRDRRG
ncbi:pseudouridine synthase [Bosea sp. WAO]|uniref:pseudouridine synthase n=1 Tax=Bosea sp. WAO TaxID=406341 RepID=UPI000829872A|nr:pseudouridine synthase [Bosea sp. WAO]